MKNSHKYIAKVAVKSGFRYFYNNSEYASYRARRRSEKAARQLTPTQKAATKYVRFLLNRKKRNSSPHNAGSF